jgi:hypothetical protein
MDVGVIVVGLAALAVLAVTIGRLTRDGYGGTERAWRAIAAERRRLWEERLQLRAEIDRCRDCPFRDTPPDDQGRRRPT